MNLKEINKVQLYQKKSILNVVAWTILLAATLFGFLNITFKTWDSVIALFGLALFCIPLLILNSKGYYSIAGILLCFIVLVVIDISLYDGDGILDSGILAMPVLILFGALLLGKRYTPLFVVAAIASLFLMVYLEIGGYIHPTIHPARYSDLYAIGILLFVASLLVWVIVNNYEKNLDQVKEIHIELSVNYDLTIKAMAKALEYRDLETAGHSTRVTELSTQLADLLGFNEQDIEHLQRGALLHDIGKLAIPDKILLKPGKLTEKEFKIMQRHPEYGRELLMGISFLEPAIPIVYSHHEHWDGNGYPDGLKGEQIPLAARIFSIIDNWDALNSDRPYRKAWSRDETMKYIAENSGIMFDPNLTKRFLEMISSQA